MRIPLIITILAAAGCSSDTTEETTNTATASTTSTSTGTTNPEPHPLVPEEYQWIWQTDGCTTYEGSEGSNLYWHAEGSADVNGDIVLTEKWYWFLGNGDWSQDCVDTFEVVGEYDAFDYAMLDCGACEEGYLVTRTLVDSTCNLTYYTMFGNDDQPEEEVYVSLELFDTLTAGGIPNQNNIMDISHGDAYPPGQLGSWLVSLNWARGHAYPMDKKNPGYPSDYDWVGDACVTAS